MYCIIHKIITCNRWLFNAKIKNSLHCDTCKCDDKLNGFFLYYVMKYGNVGQA